MPGSSPAGLSCHRIDWRSMEVAGSPPYRVARCMAAEVTAQGSGGMPKRYHPRTCSCAPPPIGGPAPPCPQELTARPRGTGAWRRSDPLSERPVGRDARHEHRPDGADRCEDLLAHLGTCLLYTSDAADEEDSV